MLRRTMEEPVIDLGDRSSLAGEEEGEDGRGTRRE